MHNRVRLVVASFLSMDLRIDWERDEWFFIQLLLDVDVAASKHNACGGPIGINNPLPIVDHRQGCQEYLHLGKSRGLR